MKRVMGLLLSMVMLMVLATGCSSAAGAPAASAPGEAVSSSSKAPAEPAENVTLTYSIWDINQQPGMEAMAKKFMEENPNITVKVEVTPWGQYWTKLQAAATGGGMPDVFWMHTNYMAQFAESNAIMDLTDRISGSELVDMDKYAKVVIPVCTVNDKYFGLPKDTAAVGLWYNKAIFDEKGVAYPDDTWTWDDLKAAAQKLTDPAKDIYGFLAPPDDESGYWLFMWQNGANVLSEDKKTSGYDKPEAIEAIQFYKSFIDEGLSPTPAQFANTNAYQYFETGKAAMAMIGSYVVTELGTFDLVVNNCDVTVMPQGKQRATNGNGLVNSIATATKHPEEAWKFLEFISSKEGMDIQAQSGAAIPALLDSMPVWVSSFDHFNMQAFIDMQDYAYPTPVTKSSSIWSQFEKDTLKQVLSGAMSVEDGCKATAQKTNETIAANG